MILDNAKAARLRRLYAGYGPHAAALFVVVLAAAFAEGLGFAMIMPLFGHVLGVDALPGELGRQTSELVDLLPSDYRLEGVLLLLAVAFAMRGGLLVLAGGMKIHFTMRLRADWARRLMRHYLTADYVYLTGQKQGVVAHNVANETFRAGRATTVLLDFIAQLILAAILSLVLLFAQWQAALAVTAAGLAVFYTVRRSSFGYSLRFGRKRQKLYHAITATAAEAMATVRQIKLFGLEDRSEVELGHRLDQHTRAETWFSVFSDLPNNLLDFTLVAAVAVILLTLSHAFAVDLKATLPLIATFAVVLYRLFGTVGFIISRRMKLASTLPSLVLVDNLLAEAPRQEDLDAGSPLSDLGEGIVFDKVDFSYADGVSVLRDFNVRIDQGRTTALIGPSGGGKSTVADLLTGLLAPTGGRIMVGGREIGQFRLRDLRRLIGYVSQEAELFDATIAENIRAGWPSAGDDEVLRAAEAAHVADFARHLPEGYETRVGERGVRLSGGQRQRIAIARVILRQPKLYIFDEATSALDHESEQLIRDAMRVLSAQATVFIIAHRLTTIEHADAIYRLAPDGRAEEVSFEEAAIRAGGAGGG